MNDKINFIVKTTPEEVLRAKKWWKDLEMQWKFAYNEAVFGKGPTIEPPTEDELMLLLVGIDTLRFAGPFAQSPNVTTPLTNLSGLIPLYNLTYLSITDMNVTAVKELVRFTKMKHMFLYNNKISSLEGIENMRELENLYVQNNQISSLIPLKNLTKLITLYVSKNKLTSLNGIKAKHAKKLKKLYVMPNDDLPDKEIIAFQNKVGIICKTG